MFDVTATSACSKDKRVRVFAKEEDRYHHGALMGKSSESFASLVNPHCTELNWTVSSIELSVCVCVFGWGG